MINTISWFEVIGSDADKTNAFYSKLFGWKLKPAGPIMEGYSLVDGLPEGALPGGLGGGFSPTTWSTFYVTVADVEATLAQALELGGTVLMPVRDMPAMRIAVFADIDGNAIGLAGPGPSAAE
jgi:hypothetical protein